MVIVGVRFKRAGKVYYFDPQAAPDVSAGDYVIVQTSRGTEVDSTFGRTIAWMI